MRKLREKELSIFIVVHYIQDDKQTVSHSQHDVGVKIGYDEINVRKDVRENFLFTKKKWSREKTEKLSKVQGSVRRNKQTSSSNTDSARPFAKLNQSSSANGWDGSTEIRLHLVLVTPLPRLHRTHSCFVSIEGIVGTLRFKNRKNPFFLEEHSD